MSVSRRQLASIGVGLLIVVLLVWFIGFGEVGTRLQRASVPLILAGLLVYVLSWPVRVLRMRKCLAVFESRIDAWSLFEINIAAYGLNMVLPAKLGDAARVLYLIDEEVSSSAALATVLFVRLADLSTVSILAVVAMGFLDLPILPGWLQQIVAGMVVLLLTVVGAAFLTRYARRSDLLVSVITAAFDRLERRIFRGAFDVGRRTAADFDRLAFSPSTFLWTGATSLLVWSLEALVAVVIAGAFGARLPFVLVLFAVSIANLAKVIPLTPAGLGVYEAAFTGVMVVFGVEAALALTVGLVEHNLKNLFNLVVGIPIATKRGTSALVELRSE